jgi:hypothetical protein
MPKKCLVENCQCCYHKEIKVKVNIEGTRECITCKVVKSNEEMRKGRNSCLECHRNKMREKYQNDEKFRNKKRETSLQYKRNLKNKKDNIEKIIDAIQGLN